MLVLDSAISQHASIAVSFRRHLSCICRDCLQITRHVNGGAGAAPRSVRRSARWSRPSRMSFRTAATATPPGGGKRSREPRGPGGRLRSPGRAIMVLPCQRPVLRTQASAENRPRWPCGRASCCLTNRRPARGAPETHRMAVVATEKEVPSRAAALLQADQSCVAFLIGERQPHRITPSPPRQNPTRIFGR